MWGSEDGLRGGELSRVRVSVCSVRYYNEDWDKGRVMNEHFTASRYISAAKMYDSSIRVYEMPCVDAWDHVGWLAGFVWDVGWEDWRWCVNGIHGGGVEEVQRFGSASSTAAGFVAVRLRVSDGLERMFQMNIRSFDCSF